MQNISIYSIVDKLQNISIYIVVLVRKPSTLLPHFLHQSTILYCNLLEIAFVPPSWQILLKLIRSVQIDWFDSQFTLIGSLTTHRYKYTNDRSCWYDDSTIAMCERQYYTTISTNVYLLPFLLPLSRAFVIITGLILLFTIPLSTPPR